MTSDERQLVERCLRGEQAAIAELVERYRGRVFGLAYRMLGHQQDAEDVSQESFVRAIRHLRHWDASRDLLPWLLAIAGNRCRTFLAIRRRRSVGSSFVDAVADHRPEPGSQLLGEEVQLALSKLRPEYRQAFLMFHDQQLSHEQIAASLGKPVGTIKTWIHRARRQLVAQLRARGVIETPTGAVS